MADTHEAPTIVRRTERFVCLDLDRTILKSTTLFYRHIEPAMQLIASRASSDQADLARRQQVIATLVRDIEENFGRSFDFLAAYNERVDPVDRLTPEQLADEICQRLSPDGLVSDRAVEEILAPRALDALAQIDDLQGADWGILTSGGLRTQRLKLLVVEYILRTKLRFEARALVVSAEHKARDIDTVWRQSDDWFRLPTQLTPNERVLARQIVLLDDKPKNLAADNLEGIVPLLATQLDAPDDGLGRIDLIDVPILIHNLDKK